jgi:hypothetical protein
MESRRKRAEEIQAERIKRSDEEQLKLILKRPGESKREFARLTAKLKSKTVDVEREKAAAEAKQAAKKDKKVTPKKG